jgi:hypothetical protein
MQTDGHTGMTKLMHELTATYVNIPKMERVGEHDYTLMSFINDSLTICHGGSIITVIKSRTMRAMRGQAPRNGRR